jgi:hypothetical protein
MVLSGCLGMILGSVLTVVAEITILAGLFNSFTSQFRDATDVFGSSSGSQPTPATDSSTQAEDDAEFRRRKADEREATRDRSEKEQREAHEKQQEELEKNRQRLNEP